MLVVALLSLGDFEDHCQIVLGERVSVCYLWYDSMSRALVDLESRLGKPPWKSTLFRRTIAWPSTPWSFVLVCSEQCHAPFEVGTYTDISG
jgi:hypothetical protein